MVARLLGVRGELIDPLVPGFAVKVNTLCWDESVVPADCGGVHVHVNPSDLGLVTGVADDISTSMAELGVSG